MLKNTVKKYLAVQLEGEQKDIVRLRDKNKYYVSSCSPFVQEWKAIRIYKMAELKENVRLVLEGVAKK